MTRTEMKEELLERIESELDDLNNTQLEALLSEYEHVNIIRDMVDNLGVLEDEVSEDGSYEEEDEEELPLLEEDWEDPEEIDEDE